MKFIFQISFLLIITTTVTFSQDLGIKLNLNIPLLNAKYESDAYSGQFGGCDTKVESRKIFSSIIAGLTSRFQLKNTNTIVAELYYDRMVANIYTRSDCWGEVWTDTYTMSNRYGSSFNYLRLPILYGISIRNIELRSGVQFSYSLKESGSTFWEVTYDDYGVSYNGIYLNENLRKYDVGPKISLVFNINKFAFETAYYHGLLDLNGDIVSKWRLRQFDFGIHYFFLKNHE